MNSSSQIKVLIDSKELLVYRINNEKDGKILREKIFESKLGKGDLPKALTELKEKHQVDSTGLLFVDDLVVTCIVQSTDGSDDERKSVQKLAEAALSIDLKKVVWDYTKVDDLFQVVCLPGDYTEYISPSFHQAGITIESIDPISIQLAKLTSNQDEPKLIIYDDVERLVTVCWRGLVFEPTLFIPVELSNKAKKIKQNFAKRFTKDVTQAVVSASFADPYVADMTILALDTKVMLLDPFTGVQGITSTEQAPEEVKKAIIEPEKIQNPTGESKLLETTEVTASSDLEQPEDFKDVWEEKPQKEEDIAAKEEATSSGEKTDPVLAEDFKPVDIKVADTNWQKPKHNLIWLVAVVSIIMLLAIGGYFLLGNKNQGEMVNPLIESSVGTDTASASVVLTDKLEYKIQVLNGSGKAGEAAKVRTLLETAGFIVEAIGNATTSGAMKTEIKSQTALPEDIQNELQGSLSDLYDTQFSVGEVTGFDVVVIVGKSK